MEKPHVNSNSVHTQPPPLQQWWVIVVCERDNRPWNCCTYIVHTSTGKEPYCTPEVVTLGISQGVTTNISALPTRMIGIHSVRLYAALQVAPHCQLSTPLSICSGTYAPTSHKLTQQSHQRCKWLLISFRLLGLHTQFSGSGMSRKYVRSFWTRCF